MKNTNYFGGSTLGWGDYNFDKNKYASIPERQLNGGLYTGEPFKKGAPWANVPVVPDEGYMTHVNLQSANPPKAALYQYNNIRPGNNYFGPIGIQPYDNKHYISCIPKKNTKESK